MARADKTDPPRSRVTRRAARARVARVVPPLPPMRREPGILIGGVFSRCPLPGTPPLPLMEVCAWADCKRDAMWTHVPIYADPDQWTRYYCDKHRCIECWEGIKK